MTDPLQLATPDTIRATLLLTHTHTHTHTTSYSLYYRIVSLQYFKL